MHQSIHDILKLGIPSPLVLVRYVAFLILLQWQLFKDALKKYCKER